MTTPAPNAIGEFPRGWTIEMHNPQGQLLEELTWPEITQESVALTYAWCIAQEHATADWPKLNAAITAKWHGKSALNRIKKRAWKQIEEWQVRGRR